MNTAPVEKLANLCGNGDHFVQFYETDPHLTDSVATFLAEGLARGEGVIVIATHAHRKEIDKTLSALGIDIQQAKAQEDYVTLDAAETLSRFIVKGAPHEGRFREAVGNIVAKISEAHPAGVRAFGEMVALLCADGNHAAAIRLEELWNQLQQDCGFSLFCAYPLNLFSKESSGQSFSHICGAHSRVLPSESYFEPPATERLKEVALLQQKAAALQAEIERRQIAEENLRRREAELEADLRATSLLYEVGKACAQPNSDIDECLQGIVDAAITLSGAEKGNLQLFDPLTGSLVIKAQRGFEQPFLDFFNQVHGHSSAACGAAMLSCARVIVEDVTRSDIFAGSAALDVLLEAGVRRICSRAKRRIFWSGGSPRRRFVKAKPVCKPNWLIPSDYRPSVLRLSRSRTWERFTRNSWMPRLESCVRILGACRCIILDAARASCVC